MINRMRKNWKLVGILAIAAIFLFLIMWGMLNPPQLNLPKFNSRPSPPPFPIHGDWELFYSLKTILSTINALLLLVLTVTYLDMYRKTHSELIIGLVVFSFVLLFYALVSNPILIRLFGFRLFGLGPFAMLPDLFTLIALSILLYLTFRY